jgi:hypothetical protein
VLVHASRRARCYPRTQRKAAEKSEKATRGKKTGAKAKDPNAPKRPLSAYMFFSSDWRERVKAENPGVGFGMCLPLPPSAHPADAASLGEVGKLLGAKWKEMDDSEKEVGRRAPAPDTHIC